MILGHLSIIASFWCSLLEPPPPPVFVGAREPENEKTMLTYYNHSELRGLHACGTRSVRFTTAGVQGSFGLVDPESRRRRITLVENTSSSGTQISKCIRRWMADDGDALLHSCHHVWNRWDRCCSLCLSQSIRRHHHEKGAERTRQEQEQKQR